jgi:hypothetical protein
MLGQSDFHGGLTIGVWSLRVKMERAMREVAGRKEIGICLISHPFPWQQERGQLTMGAVLYMLYGKYRTCLQKIVLIEKR